MKGFNILFIDNVLINVHLYRTFLAGRSKHVHINHT